MLAAFNLLGVLITLPLIHRFGRRTLLSVSCLIITLSLAGCTWASYKNKPSFSLAGIGLYVIAFEVGAGPIPWLMVSELCPIDFRGTIMAIATAFNWISNYAVVESFPSTTKALTEVYAFTPYIAINFMSLLFVSFFLPETKDRSVKDVQAEIQGRPITVHFDPSERQFSYERDLPLLDTGDDYSAQTLRETEKSNSKPNAFLQY